MSENEKGIGIVIQNIDVKFNPLVMTSSNIQVVKRQLEIAIERIEVSDNENELMEYNKRFEELEEGLKLTLEDIKKGDISIIEDGINGMLKIIRGKKRDFRSKVEQIRDAKKSAVIDKYYKKYVHTMTNNECEFIVDKKGFIFECENSLKGTRTDGGFEKKVSEAYDKVTEKSNTQQSDFGKLLSHLIGRFPGSDDFLREHIRTRILKGVPPIEIVASVEKHFKEKEERRVIEEQAQKKIVEVGPIKEVITETKAESTEKKNVVEVKKESDYNVHQYDFEISSLDEMEMYIKLFSIKGVTVEVAQISVSVKSRVGYDETREKLMGLLVDKAVKDE